MSFSELENDILNQAELNEIKLNEKTKWKSEKMNPYLALRVYVGMSEIHETGDVWHTI